MTKNEHLSAPSVLLVPIKRFKRLGDKVAPDIGLPVVMHWSRLWSGHKVKVIVNSGIGSHTPCFSLDPLDLHPLSNFSDLYHKACVNSGSPHLLENPFYILVLM
jgi:hypothetical protein